MTNSDARERARKLALHMMGRYSDGTVEAIDAATEEYLSFAQSLEAEVAANSYGAAAQEVAYNMTAYLIDGVRYVRPEDAAHAIDMLTPQAAQEFAKRREVKIRLKVLEEAALSVERRARQWSTNLPFATSASIDINAELRNEAMTIRALAGAAPGEETK